MANNDARILLVESYEALRSVIAHVLGEAGYRVRLASNGRQARAVLERWGADLILLDLGLSGMDDWAFGAVRGSAHATGGAPVLALSAIRLNPVQQAALGVSAVLFKPFERRELLDAVERVLEYHAATESALPSGPRSRR